MSSNEEIEKKKYYYERLKQVIDRPYEESRLAEIEQSIREERDDDFLVETLSLWREVTAPFANAVAFVFNNRLIPENKEYFLNEISQKTFLQPDEIFSTLRMLIKTTVVEFLSVLEITSSGKTKMLSCVENNDREGFVSLIESFGCDTTVLARLCSCCMEDSFALKNPDEDDCSYLLDFLVDDLKKKGDYCVEKLRNAAKQWQPSVEKVDAEPNMETYSQYASDYRHFLEEHFALVLHIYWDLYDDFNFKEHKLIDNILDNPLAVELVGRIREEYLKGLEPEPFTLPDDYFSSDNLSGRMKEYFCLKNEVRRKGVQTFVDLVNWLAEEGYIANDNETKALFAYRLTGRCRPEGDVLPVIEWRGRENRSYELIYIVKNLADRGDYRKMRLFFTGPDWVNGFYSSYADSANSEFRRKMSDIYPEVCKFKK